MANQHQIIIEGYAVKELRCKNDECRALIGYENIKLGVFIQYCQKCGHLSIYNMQYKALGREFIKKLQTEFESKNSIMKGGE